MPSAASAEPPIVRCAPGATTPPGSTSTAALSAIVQPVRSIGSAPALNTSTHSKAASRDPIPVLAKISVIRSAASGAASRAAAAASSSSSSSATSSPGGAGAGVWDGAGGSASAGGGVTPSLPGDGTVFSTQTCPLSAIDRPASGSGIGGAR